MKNKALSLTMAVLMLCAALTTAAMAQTIVPLWDNVSSVTCDLSFSGTTANCSAKVTGKSGTTKINAQLLLQEQQANGSYVTVKFWPLQTTTSLTLNLSGSQSGCTSGTYYRTGVVTNVYNSAGVSEAITVYSTPVRCP